MALSARLLRVGLDPGQFLGAVGDRMPLAGQSLLPIAGSIGSTFSPWSA